MPSFDIVSEVDLHELQNAVDQTNREVSNRFDFKDTGAHVARKDHTLTLHAPSDFQVGQLLTVLHTKLAKRGIDISALDAGQVMPSGKEAKQDIEVRHGIETTTAKRMVKRIKDAKLKVQAAIQGERVRVTGKKRDDLQGAIALLREAEFEVPLQFVNFRD